ncbi:hypothetical protein AU381_01930 [Sinorhizobium glycinis]|uniref:Uncharacterized protein n=1 Tax=Sinorhizobium glycinis TaxID=1472378 RepID=A0A178XZM4_9HYPH|nr:hypothetical protein AU381_01930 [Sinorhizobium glycinis]
MSTTDGGHRGAAVFGGGTAAPRGEVMPKANRDDRAGGGGGSSGAFSSKRPTLIEAGRSHTDAISTAAFRMSMPPGSKQCEGLYLGCL